MWEAEKDESEDEGLFEEMRPIPLPDGRSHYVAASAHPMLMEWDWQFDPLTEQVVRFEKGKKRPLYEEQLRWYFKRREQASAPVLDHRAVRVLFGHHTAFRAMLQLSQRQREYATMEGGYNLPLTTDILSAGLSLALLHFYEWHQAPERWSFVPDVTGLTPGTLVQVTTPPAVYDSLGKWMQHEYTGEWGKSRTSATGLAPLTYAKRTQRDLLRLWRGLVRLENFGEVEPRDVDNLLRRGKRPIFLTVRYICDLISQYELGT